MPGDRPDLQDLVDNPPEVLDVELKDWMDLTDGVVRANIARHIAALANHGGGYLVFGFRDDLSPNPASPFSLGSFDRDSISSIVKKYLTPTFQCEINFVTSSAGFTHPVIWVPSHGAVPVCSKADGPQDARSRPQGININTYYIRAPGPESVPITAPEQWAPLIRRCVIHERTSLLGMFDSLLRAPPSPNPTDALKHWHERADARFIELAEQREVSPLTLQSRVNLSYAVHTADNQLLDARHLIEIVRQVHLEVHDLVSSPLLFYPYTLEEIAPYFIEDPESGQDSREILECALFEDVPIIFPRTDFWRVSLDGLATHVRPFWEDREDMRVPSNREPGSWFCPFYLVRTLAELTRHARAFAARFAARTQWSFGVSGTGSLTASCLIQDL